MLQFVTERCKRFSIAEEVQMAIEGGCKWIELDIEGLEEGREVAIRQVAEEVIPLCREAGVYLIIADDADVALQLECHGLHLRKGDITPAQAREKLGASAIIGVSVTTAADVAALRSLDIDYLTVDDATPAKVTLVAQAAEQAGVAAPIVAAGKDVGIISAPALISAGAKGVAAGYTIVHAEDPVLYTASLIKALS